MPYENQTFCVIGAGELQVPLIKAAKNLGLTVLATDQNPNAVGFEFSDYAIIADTLNPTETLEKIYLFIQNNGSIHGIATAGTDASYTVAVVANALGLPGHSPEAAEKASNKALMRETFFKHNVPIPNFQKINNYDDALLFFEKIDKPCVVKPINNMGARGASLVSDIEELKEAIQLAQSCSRNVSDILIEEYIDAHELSIDALVHDGSVTITGVADRIIEYAPYFVETGHILPSSLPEHLISKAILAFTDGIKALGLTHGAAKGDIKVSEHGVWIIEIAGRLSGGFMSSHTFRFATGIHLHEYMVRLALGEKLPNIVPIKNWVSVERAIIPSPGMITDISIPENLLDEQYIEHFSIRKNINDIIISPKNNVDKAGNIIACAPTRALALQAANRALSKIIISTSSSSDDINIILEESNNNAKTKISQSCTVCKRCNGISCRGKIPGVGGVGNGEGFIESYERMQSIKLIPSYIHEIRSVDTSIEMFGQQHSMPVFTAPIGGAYINYNDSISELEFQRAFIKGANLAGTIAFLPDPAPPELFEDVLQVILENFGKGILICKPRSDMEMIKNRFDAALGNGILGIGTDIDGIGLATFKLAKQSVSPKSLKELKELSSQNKENFIVKGILNPKDAELAIQAGATHIIVSSHGGRINEAFPTPLDMLPEIIDIVGGRIPVLLDGAIRSGADVAKAIILGADAVLIGRPVAIHAIGGRSHAVCAYLQKIKQELESTLLLLGIPSISELKGQKHLIRYVK